MLADRRLGLWVTRWSYITKVYEVQRSFTKHITGMRDLSYHERLQTLRLYSLQRRRERYCIILIWKVIESKAQNLSDPILFNFSDRRGRSCVISHVNTGRQGTLAYNSFRWRAIRLFNSLPKSIRDITNCSVCSFKQRLDRYLNSIPDLPCTPGYNNTQCYSDSDSVTLSTARMVETAYNGGHFVMT